MLYAGRWERGRRSTWCALAPTLALALTLTLTLPLTLTLTLTLTLGKARLVVYSGGNPSNVDQMFSYRDPTSPHDEDQVHEIVTTDVPYPPPSLLFLPLFLFNVAHGSLNLFFATWIGFHGPLVPPSVSYTHLTLPTN